ncbi:hypothetical protein B484DRAFT_415656, partial [Ochromonadaceae sp. CCMP2298]
MAGISGVAGLSRIGGACRVGALLGCLLDGTDGGNGDENRNGNEDGNGEGKGDMMDISGNGNGDGEGGEGGGDGQGGGQGGAVAAEVQAAHGALRLCVRILDSVLRMHQQLREESLGVGAGSGGAEGGAGGAGEAVQRLAMHRSCPVSDEEITACIRELASILAELLANSRYRDFQALVGFMVGLCVDWGGSVEAGVGAAMGAAGMGPAGAGAAWAVEAVGTGAMPPLARLLLCCTATNFSPAAQCTVVSAVWAHLRSGDSRGDGGETGAETGAGAGTWAGAGAEGGTGAEVVRALLVALDNPARLLLLRRLLAYLDLQLEERGAGGAGEDRAAWVGWGKSESQNSSDNNGSGSDSGGGGRGAVQGQGLGQGQAGEQVQGSALREKLLSSLPLSLLMCAGCCEIQALLRRLIAQAVQTVEQYADSFKNPSPRQDQDRDQRDRGWDQYQNQNGDQNGENGNGDRDGDRGQGRGRGGGGGGLRGARLDVGSAVAVVIATAASGDCALIRDQNDPVWRQVRDPVYSNISLGTALLRWVSSLAEHVARLVQADVGGGGGGGAGAVGGGAGGDGGQFPLSQPLNTHRVSRAAGLARTLQGLVCCLWDRSTAGSSANSLAAGGGAAGRPGVPKGVQMVLLRAALRCAQAAARVARAGAGGAGGYGGAGGAGGTGGGVGVGVAGASACSEACSALFSAVCAALHVVSGPTLGEACFEPARQVFAHLEMACRLSTPTPTPTPTAPYPIGVHGVGTWRHCTMLLDSLQRFAQNLPVNLRSRAVELADDLRPIQARARGLTCSLRGEEVHLAGCVDDRISLVLLKRMGVGGMGGADCQRRVRPRPAPAPTHTAPLTTLTPADGSTGTDVGADVGVDIGVGAGAGVAECKTASEEVKGGMGAASSSGGSGFGGGSRNGNSGSGSSKSGSGSGGFYPPGLSAAALDALLLSMGSGVRLPVLGYREPPTATEGGERGQEGQEGQVGLALLVGVRSQLLRLGMQ